MAPKMFHYNRSYMTPEQYSLTVKSLDSTTLPQTCAQKYSQYASIPSAGRTTGSSNSYRKVTNCTKLQNVYLNGKFIGRNFCIKI